VDRIRSVEYPIELIYRSERYIVLIDTVKQHDVGLLLARCALILDIRRVICLPLLISHANSIDNSFLRLIISADR